MGLPPMQPPAIHPFNPLLSLRVASNQWGSPRTQNAYVHVWLCACASSVLCRSACVSQPHAARALLHSVISALFQAVWFESQDVTQPGVVARCVSQALAATGETGAAASVSPEEVLALRNDVEMKNRLHFATEDAIARGVFGVPTMEVVSEADGGSPDAPGEMFFGFDDLPYMQMFLDGKVHTPVGLRGACSASGCRHGGEADSQRALHVGAVLLQDPIQGVDLAEWAGIEGHHRKR